MKEILLSTLFGVFSSLVASALYFRYSYSLKPDISISPCISKWKTSSGEIKYSVKIVNNTNRDVMNIKAQLFTVKLLKVSNEDNTGVDRITESTKLSLVKEELMELKGKNDPGQFAPFEFRFYTTFDIELFLKKHDDAHITAKVFCTDAKTGFGKVFTRTYTGHNSIKEGPFKSKHSLDVEKV